MQWFCFHQNQLFKCSTFIFSFEKPEVTRVNPWVLVRVWARVERQKRGRMVAGWWFRTQTTAGLESKPVLLAQGA